jgi:DNA-binding transcriptional MerR regulator
LHTSSAYAKFNKGEASMSKKNELLSIGELSKITGAGIHALRYYERKNILKPTFTDPDSGYRYYSLDQIYFVQLITNCVNLDIPLKELTGILDADDMNGLQQFFIRNKEVAEKKAKLLKSSIDGFNEVLEKMELRKLYSAGQIYLRKFVEKTYYIKRYEQSLKGANRLKLLLEMAYEKYGENFNRTTIDDNPDEFVGLPEFGCMRQHSPDGFSYYLFAEINKQTADKNAITIPAGTYFFRQDESSYIENSLEIFKEHISGKDTFTIIETEEPFLSKTKINQPMYELRFITL